MAECRRFFKKLVRRKVFTGHDLQATALRRCLSTLDLVCLGVGSTLGLGVYILTGQVAKETAGPSIVLSFLIAGIASAFAGLCYAEFAARVPRAGSAYVYSYVTVGELMAFVIGWNLLLEYIIGTASVARAWSAYLDSLIDKRIENFFRLHMPMNVWGLSGYPDFFAFAITQVVTVLLAVGVKESTRLNNVFVCVNLLVIATVVICGIIKADLANWSLSESRLPASGAGSGGFFPFGLSGMMSGAATCFYAYVGFDTIATTGEETKDPQKSIPVSIVLTLLVVGVAYCGVGAVVTLMSPYFLLDTRAPLPFIFDRLHWDAVKYVITFGALFGLSTSLLGAMFPLPRILYAMGTDGLLFRCLGRVSDRFHTPLLGTFLSGLLAGVMSMLFDLDSLVDMMSIGTLLAYTLVAVCVLFLRYETEENLPNLNYSQPSSVVPPQRLEGTERESVLCCGRLVSSSSSSSAKRPSATSSTVVKYSVALLCLFMAVFSTASVTMEGLLADGAWYAILVLTVAGILTLLCVVLIRCQPQNTTELSFKVPLVPYIPAFSCMVNIYLMVKLNYMTWIRFAVWMVTGLSIYLLYGIRQSSVSDTESKVSLLASSSDDRGSYTCLIHHHHHHQQQQQQQQQHPSSSGHSPTPGASRSESLEGLEESVH